MKKNPSFKISIKAIPPEGMETPVFLGPEWFARWLDQEPGLEFSVESPLTGTLRLEKPGEYLLIRGKIVGDLRFTCSRCLDTFLGPLECQFDLLLKPGPSPDHREEVELTTEELTLDYYAGDELDVDRIIQEQILLAVPLKPLCRQECRGLCPSCGANLNRESCSCHVTRFHQPFAILDKLTKTSR